jgi:hypothetical protein
MSDYLWDKSGPPDPDVERLEQLLSEFAYRTAPPVRRMRPRHYLGIAAAVIAIAGAAMYGWRMQSAGWEVASLEGVPRIGSNPIAGKAKLTKGKWLETDSESRAQVEIGAIGDVEVAPGSRVGLVRSHASEQRMALERGRIRASIFAPPRIFIVDTPSATAVDLGCVYTLEVDDAGSGLLKVVAGWVSLEANGRESFIPATAVCLTRKGSPPGTPYFEDAPDSLRTALERFDFEKGGYEALREVLAAARPEDGLTLWHLLSKTTGPEREAVYHRMAALAPPPAGVTREGILAGDAPMLEAWWNSLGLGDASWWRKWTIKPAR